MSSFRTAFHHPEGSPEDRFLTWVDELVDPGTGNAPAPDPNFADVAETATTVHRAAGLGSTMTLPTERTDAMWEDLMNTTTMPATAMPHPATSNRSPLPPASSSRLLPAPRPGWRSYLLTAALIAAIVVASVATIWRITDPFDGNDSNTASQPGFLASATPAVESPDGCPLTSDMLVFAGEAPVGVDDVDLTMAVVQPDGDFVITCGGVGDPEPLVTGVTDATSLPWPGTVLLEQEGGTAVAYNIETDQGIPLGDFDLVSIGSMYSNPGSPWLLTPNNDAYTDWRVTNLETMRSLILSAEIGGVLEEDVVPSIVSAPSADNAIVSFQSFFEPSGLPDNAPNATATIAELPDGGLVVDATFDTRRWIDTWGQLAISADGEAIAYQTQIDLVPMVRVEEATTGNVLVEITDINFNTPSNALFAFAGDGSSIVYLIDNEVWLATYGGEPTTALLGTGDMLPAALYPTGVPGRVLIERSTGENIGGPGIPGAKAVSILDTATGQVTDVEGLYPIFASSSPGQIDSLQYIVTLMPSPASGSETIARITDIASGEAMLTSEPIEVSVREVVEGNNMISSSGTGAIAVVNTPGGEAVLLNATSDTMASISTASLASNEGLGDIRWSVATSQDGQHLYAIGLPQTPGMDIESPSDLRQMGSFAIAPISADPQWSAPTDTLPSGIILGIPDGDQDDEPTTLDAQEVTPLKASPVATLATPPAAASSPGCDLSGDIPVVTGADVLPWQETVMVFSDGTLSLQCNGGATVIADGVTSVRGTGWPGSFIATMEDGTLRGINLLTGAIGDFGPETVLTESVADYEPFGVTPGSPWMLIPANPEMTDWRIIDLRTMESLLLSDEIGGMLPDSTVTALYASTSDAAVIGFPGYIADRSDPLGRAAATPPPGAIVNEMAIIQQSALVIDGSLENRHWTDVSRRGMTSAAISPDGELLAVERLTDSGMTVRAERLSDGELVANTGIELGADDFFLVLNDEAGLLHLTENRLDLVTWDPELVTETLFEFDTGQGPPILALTADPDIAIASLVNADDEGEGYLVDTATGETTEIPNLMHSPFLAYANDGVPPRYVLAASPGGEDGQQVAIQLIDVTTGEAVVESSPVAIGPAQVALQPSMLRSHGTIGISVYEPGHAIVLNAVTNESFEIEVPTDVEGVSANDAWYFYPSVDGTFITATPDVQTGAPLFARQLTSDAAWIEVPPGSIPAVIVGSHALPEPDES